MATVLVLLALTLLDVPRDYLPAWMSLPERHRAFVRGVYVDRTSGGKAREATMTIHVPPFRSERQARKTLTHEVCHILAWSDRRLEAAWQARFWPGGRATGQPPTRYAASSQDEDFAQSCEKARDGDGPDDPDRARFFVEWGVWP